MNSLGCVRAYFGSIAVVCLMISCPAITTGAQQKEPSYGELVKRVRDGDLSIDFRALRQACLRADDCDPRGDSDDLVAMRRAMQAKQYEKAAKAAGKLIDKGFTNIEAHVIRARAYAELKEAEKAQFHQGVASGLIRSILSTGDGKTKETAFEVLGTHEEYLVVAILGFPRPTSQSVIPGKPHSYDVLETRDPKTGEKVTLYFNIDAFFPMKL